MADVFNKEKRSHIMRQIKSRNNKSTELKLIKWFKANGIKGWRRGYPVKGKPDFVFPKLRIAVFADGCFWHGHDCRNTRPAQNKDYWTAKRERNIKRDTAVSEYLSNRGWVVVRVWECEIKKQTFGEKLQPLIAKSKLPE